MTNTKNRPVQLGWHAPAPLDNAGWACNFKNEVDAAPWVAVDHVTLYVNGV